MLLKIWLPFTSYLLHIHTDATKNYELLFFLKDNEAWRLHDKTNCIFFVILISNEQRYQTLNDNKKRRRRRPQGHVKKVLRRSYFISPSVSPSSSLCIFFIPPFLLPNIWKLNTSMLYKSHTFTHRPHTHNIVIYLQILDRTQMIRFITKA